jgi:hypothetical protein
MRSSGIEQAFQSDTDDPMIKNHVNRFMVTRPNF